MKDGKLISVILPVYNEPLAILKKAVDSVLNQTYKNLEIIIIIDNPTNDELIAFLQCYQDNRIKLLKNEKNIGLAASLNKGIRYAQADIIARMDGDDICALDRIEKELFFLESNDYDLVATDIDVIDEEGEKIPNIYFAPKSRKEFEKRIRYEDCVAHPTWMFKRSCYDSVSGYKEVLMAAQDYEFVYHAHILGKKIGCLNEKLLSYRVRSGSISNRKKIQQLYITYYIKRTYGKNEQFSSEYIEKALRGEVEEYKIFEKQWAQCNAIVVPVHGVKQRMQQLYCFVRYRYARVMYTDMLLAVIYRLLYSRRTMTKSDLF